MPRSIPNAAVVDFPPFQLDLRAGQLLRDGTPVHLRPKTYAVLKHLVERPGELVTKQALLDVVWGEVAVSEDVVRLSAGELRAALGDDRAAPRFIETVPRRGYRFIARMGGTEAPTDTTVPAFDDVVSEHGVVVGRVRERATIAEWLKAATGGRRQIGFVTGEAGIGKTTLVDTVLRDLRRAPGAGLRIARGQCIEHFGGGDPYMPVLAALASLCRDSDGSTVTAILRTHAPAWLLSAMGVLAPGEVDRAKGMLGSREHTLQRLAACLDVLAAETPLVLVLEDVQWSDYSTLDLLSVVAQRRTPARLLVLCTLRPADAIVSGHPVGTIKRELLRKELCREILLEGLSPGDVTSYLVGRFPAADLPADLLPLLVERSDGSPFFLVTLVDHLLEQQLLVDSAQGWELRGTGEALRTAVPDGLRAVIEPRLERLEADELRVLEAASVAGLEFAAHAVAAVAAKESDLGDVEYVEQRCDTLARRQEILRALGESAWPDGTSSARYAFRHAFYQQVIYQRLLPSIRSRCHQAIGERLEAAYGDKTAEVASELAAHFERSRDVARAIRHHADAAARARGRFAYRETCLHLEAALDLMRTRSESEDALRHEMELLEDLGTTLFGMRGYGDEDGARAFARMRELAERLDGAQGRFQAMEGQLIVRTMRAELAAARTLGEEMIVLAEQLNNPAGAATAHTLLSATLFNLSEVEAAQQHAEQARALFDPEAPPLPNNVGIPSSILVASACGYFGLVARARELSREALARADTLGTPFHRALATNLASQICMLLDDPHGAAPLAGEAVEIATQYDLAAFRITATMVRAWCDVEAGRVDEGLAALRGAFEEHGATGQRYGTTCFSLILARAYLAAGDPDSANQILDAALAFAAETGERVYEPELYRLKGLGLLTGGATRARKTDAIGHFERAITIAAERKALLYELRATSSLCRVQQSARERLTRIIDCFDADADCADLRAGRALLAASPKSRL